MTAEGSDPFLEQVRAVVEGGGLPVDDVLGRFLPLCRQVIALHEQGLVAPLDGTAGLTVTEGRLGIDASKSTRPRGNLTRVRALQGPDGRAVDVIGESGLYEDLDEGTVQATNLSVATATDTVERLVYVPGYRSWEHLVGHHDELTDVFSLGQVLASLACGLDLTDPDDVALLARHHANPFALAPRIHPVVAAVIRETTELDRRRRAQDLPSVVRRLEFYREQQADLDLAQIPGFSKADVADRRALLHTHLRERLFDVSRRNRLLYFRPTAGTVNLTVSSVPLVLDRANVRREHLFTWNDDLAKEAISGKPLSLARWLRFEDQPWLPAAVDRLIADERKDRSEYGFSQLRLVVAFLRWHDLKEEPDQRIHSPLLLLPVVLSKKKGVRDRYVLEVTEPVAEVNPVLRHRLRQLYGLELPESVDLETTSIAEFHQALHAAIRASEPAIELEKVDQPQIELIHAKAKQRLDQWRRRARPKGPAAAVPLAAGGYGREGQRPRGLAIFLEHVRPRPAPMRVLVDPEPAPRPMDLVDARTSPDPGTTEKERELFVLRKGEEEGHGNPYVWELDLCAVTLGNFNYRKMTLVRDYSNLIETGASSPSFDRVFSLDPKPPAVPPPAVPLADRFLVIPADATQIDAVAMARTGRSLIIQGPPGTGKSQTITNVIVDHVARGKRVLFVCEKRAAIDVVFHRLRSRGLADLCALIHDSQVDKKEFIQQLKSTSESWLADAAVPDDSETRRTATVRALEKELVDVRAFSDAMSTVSEDVGTTLHRLLARLVECGPAPALDARVQETLPGYVAWGKHGETITRLGKALVASGAEPVFALHPFRRLAPALLGSETPLGQLLRHLERAEPWVDEIDAALASTGLPPETWKGAGDVEALLAFAAAAKPLGTAARLLLLDPSSEAHRSFLSVADRVASAERAVESAAAKTKGWRSPLPPGETADALAAATKYEASWLSFLSGTWRKVKRTLRERYDLSTHAIPPKWSRVLRDLLDEHEAVAKRDAALAEFERTYGSRDAQGLRSAVGAAVATCHVPVVARLRDRVLEEGPGGRLLARLSEAAARHEALTSCLREIWNDADPPPWGSLGENLRDLRETSDALPELLPVLRDVAALPEQLQFALRTIPLACAEFEAALGAKSVMTAQRAEPVLARLDGPLLARKTARLAALARDLADRNAEVVRSRVKRRFLEAVRLSTTSVTQLDDQQRQKKRVWSAGRRILEHEFGKTMRYKSIRELCSGEAGEVIRSLKPIWLMSPLSISDSLPLDGEPFDVVIFDEASQIPVEEAVPALHRAPQAVVVGDEMQLPPTTFFSAARDDGEDGATDDAAPRAERVSVDLDADSFLVQCAKNLPSTMLAWHYRSRHEALIHFSNVSFYRGALRTVPDRAIAQGGRAELLVAKAEDARDRVDDVLSRSISFHRCPNAVYADRKNPLEAAYLAELVRALLARGTGLSLGVVAFSEAQQAEIQTAIDALAETDEDFAKRLEAELSREEDDQFHGLFVKNLENVQGDERDVILLSICYGPDLEGKVRMNFGPINQSGGEKRLNVIFSRARHHMAVVSSIRHGDVTNEWNDGAAALKSFLRFAETVSSGDVRGAVASLASAQIARGRGVDAAPSRDATAASIAARLRAQGWDTEERVGSSRFRCDVAVRAKGEPAHRLAVLIDNAEQYATPDLLERYVSQPGVLQLFGWNTELVLTKDWWQAPETVLARLERRLKGEPPEVGDATVEPVQPDAGAQPALGGGGRVGTPPSTTAPAFRRFEFVEGNSRKFWEITANGAEMIVRYGRIGSNGQMQTKTFDSPGRATYEVNKLVNEKLRKGYLEAAGKQGEASAP